MDIQTQIKHLVVQLSERLVVRQQRVTVAESCTGGSLAAAMTDIPGSSQWFECGYITYSNESKQKMLGVPEITLKTHGAVSEEVVCAMAEGAIGASGAEIGVAISGVAGPGGGSPDKPVGTVWIAWAGEAMPSTSAQCYCFEGDREAIRQQAVKIALEYLIIYTEKRNG